MKVTVISIVICALGTVTKGLVQELEDLEIRGRVETIQTTALLRSARIQRRVLETWGDLLSFRLGVCVLGTERSSNDWEKTEILARKWNSIPYAMLNVKKVITRRKWLIKTIKTYLKYELSSLPFIKAILQPLFFIIIIL